MIIEKRTIEIPLIIVKDSIYARERNYKCKLCNEVLRRLFQFEDHWLKHFPNGANLEDGDGGVVSPDASCIHNDASCIHNILNPFTGMIRNDGNENAPYLPRMKIKSKHPKTAHQENNAAEVSDNGKSRLNTINPTSLKLMLTQQEAISDDDALDSSRDLENVDDDAIDSAIDEIDDGRGGRAEHGGSRTFLHTFESPIDAPEDILINVGAKQAAQEIVIEEQVVKTVEIPTGNSPNESKLLKCPLCMKLIGDSSNFVSHVREHKLGGPGGVSCPVCHRSYAKDKFGNHLRRHLNHIANDNRLSCPVCLKRFRDTENVNTHIAFCHKEDMAWMFGASDSLEQSSGTEIETDVRSTGSVAQKLVSSGKAFGIEFEDHGLEKRKSESILDGPTVKRPKLVGTDKKKCLLCDLHFKYEASYYSHMLQIHCRDCPSCGINLPTPHLMAKHQLMHVVAERKGEEVDLEKEQRTCVSCRMEFASTEETEKHSCKLDDNQCHYCFKKVLSFGKFFKHIKKHATAKKIYECSICSFRTHAENSYIKHKAEHSTHPSPFQCEQCPYRAKQFHSLEKHMHKHDERYKFICNVCGRALYQARSIRNHMVKAHKIYNIDKPYECDKCQRQCYTIGALEKHRRSHPNKGDVECTLCPEKFANKRLMTLHKKEAHLHNIAICHVCGRYCETQLLLEKHMTQHEDSVYSCEICDKNFSSHPSLTIHWYQHKDLICKCSSCGLCMKKSSLSGHKLVHLQRETRVNKHCRLCGEVLETVEDIIQHCLNNHNMNEGSKEIELPDDLVEHSLPCDFAPRRWACTICSKTFISEKDWMQHFELHEFKREQEVKCRSCDGFFFDKNKFIKHVGSCVRRKRLVNSCIGWNDGVVIKGKKIALDKPSTSAENPKPSEDKTQETSTDSENTAAKKHPLHQPITCVLCLRLFDSAEGMAYHLLTTCDELDEDERCWRCDAVVSWAAKLKKHKREKKNPCKLKESHNSLPSVPCNDCNRNFINEIFLQIHTAQLHEAGEFKCVHCSTTFRYRNEVEKHVYEHVEKTELAGICSVCGYKSENLYDLRKHLEGHWITVNLA